MKKIRLWLKKMFSNKRFTIAFSIFVAFISWLVITLDQNPIREATLSNVAIQIDVSSFAAGDMGLDIVSNDYTKTATVTVQGPNYIVSALRSSDIVVYADLSGVTDAGEHDIPLFAKASNGAAGYTVVNISPNELEKLKFDYFDTREFTVEVKADGIRGVSASGLIADQAVVSSAADAKISIRGTITNLDKIGSVVALVNKEEFLDATKTYDADILLYDEAGNLLNSADYTLSAEKVKVTVPICKRKVLAVTPTFINEPYPSFGKELVSSLSTDYVTVIGPPTVIDKLDYIELSEIDFSEISKQKRSFEVEFSLPDGVKVEDSSDFITVDFNLNGYSTRNFTLKNSNVIFKNVGEDLSASINGNIKNVVICGNDNVVRGLTSNDLYLEIDLSGKSSGEYRLNAVVKGKNNLPVWQVGSCNLTVIIE